MPRLSRREFLQISVCTALALRLERLARAEERRSKSSAIPAYRDWEDLYRTAWRWDRIARGTHTSANCVASCAWNLYVRDDMVWREEQSAPYEPSNRTVPDWNPRGCQKGASCSSLMLGATRLRYPLRRVGPRGSDRWQRVSWEEALGEIAGALVETLGRRGGEGVIGELGGNYDAGPTLAATLRFFRLIGAPVTDPTAHTGDLFVGGVITMGAGFTGGSSDDWFRSDYLVLWAINPAVTRIPDAHFIYEARYRGAQVVTIAPDYNQSAIHGDLWISPRPGTDGALALAACHVIVDEELYQADYLREQTDMPFLVRGDNHRFLRQSDVVEGGRDNVFAIWNENTSELFWAPGSQGSTERHIRLPSGVRPALDARAEVRLTSGEHVPVRTVFSLLRERLGRVQPERAALVTGVSPAVIRRFAREFARAGAALILTGFGGCKNYHGDLIQRAQILLASLTANLGRPGGGWRSAGFISLEGLGLLGTQEEPTRIAELTPAELAQIDPAVMAEDALAGYVSSTLFHTVHAGLGEVRMSPADGDPDLPRPPQAYFDEALAKGHFPVGPAPGAMPPEVIVSVCGNVLRHSRLGQRVRDTLFANARLVVDIGFRMSETSRHADLVLPAAGWYEKMGLKYLPGLVPYVTLADRAVPPAGESKPEWEVCSLLAQAIAAEARRRGMEDVRGFGGKPCNLATLDRRFSDGGRFGPQEEEEVLRFILSTSRASAGVTLEKLRQDSGAVRVSSLGPETSVAGFFTDYRPDEPITPLRDFVEQRRPYPTLTGRQQFYIDHPWFLELGEELPVHKDPPPCGGDHPFVLTSGHTRWSIHSMWRDHAMMLRLARGEPVIYLNATDARGRGIADHDWVRVWNDHGSFVARAKPTGAIRPGQVHIFHGWEPFQFRDGRSHQAVVPSPIKPTQLVGDYGHLRWGFSYYEPNAVDRDTRVDVSKV